MDDFYLSQREREKSYDSTSDWSFRIAMLDRPNDIKNASEFPAELLIWLSPAFPVGAFAYSQGLETAVARRWVSDLASLRDWLAALGRYGALRNDLILLSLIRRAPNETAIGELAELSAALQPSKERAEESLTQGQAFMDAYNAAMGSSHLRSVCGFAGRPDHSTCRNRSRDPFAGIAAYRHTSGLRNRL